MPETNSIDTGKFSWAELSTTDQDAAKKFYTSLFGWDTEDAELPGGGMYSMFTVKGRYVGAASTQMEHERSQGIPPHWNVYMSVDDADMFAKKAESLGGTVIAPAFDVLESGRMAVIADPTGAPFGLWQARQHQGFGLINEPGAVDWFELMTPDTDKAGPFYGELFDWKSESTTMGNAGDGIYTVFSKGETPVAGMLKPPAGIEMPPFWTVYYDVTDCDAVAAKVKELGGEIHFGPQFIETVGKFAGCADPQGATFAILTPDPTQRQQ